MERKVVDSISRAVEGMRDEIIDFTMTLVRELSETPPGDERGVCRLLTGKAAEWGLPAPEVISSREERPNLLFTVRGNHEGRTLVLSGHTDTKPVGDASPWIIDPYEPEIIDGRMYGRGTTDMKGAIVAMLAAAHVLGTCGVDLHGDLMLAFTADEEGGSAYGARLLTERGLKADAVVIGEPSGTDSSFDTIHIACRGASLGQIEVRGTQMHSSLSDRGGCINASVKMAKVLTAFADHLKENIRFTPHELYPLGPTVNPGVTLSGGIFYGVVPGEASFGFDIRVIPGMTHKGLVEDIEAFLAKLRKEDPELRVEYVPERPPLNWLGAVEIERDHPVVGACRDAVKTVMDIDPLIEGAPFGTDGVYFKGYLGIPTIPSFGPGLIKLAHGPNEYVGVDDLVNSVKIFAIAAADYLSAGT